MEVPAGCLQMALFYFNLARLIHQRWYEGSAGVA